MNTELIKALRYCGNFADRDGCDEECPYFNDKDCPNRIMCDSADALEAAEKRIAELEKQLPKEGEWIEDEYGYIHCSRCRMEWDEPEHPQTNFCPNCGARMDGETEHGNTYSLGKIEMPKGVMEQIIADGERKDGEHDNPTDNIPNSL